MSLFAGRSGDGKVDCGDGERRGGDEMGRRGEGRRRRGRNHGWWKGRRKLRGKGRRRGIRRKVDNKPVPCMLIIA